jgi:superoxide reductase
MDMTKRNEIYKVVDSANNSTMVEVLIPSDGALACGTPMVENTTDAAREKHVPVVEKIEGGYRVTVGEVNHPMTEAHYIQWIELITNRNEVLRKYLTPTDAPVAEFKTDADEVYAREYCNLHGLWRSK